jgi:two-component system OmpR family response regulator
MKTASLCHTGTGPDRLRVLVVDDNRDAADSCALMLQLWGHETVAAYDAATALQAAGRFRPHAILLDLSMPKTDGFHLAQTFRQPGPACEARLIAVTGHTGQVFRDRATAAGFDHVLIKPVALDELRELLAKRTGRDQLAAR